MIEIDLPYQHLLQLLVSGQDLHLSSSVLMCSSSQVHVGNIEGLEYIFHIQTSSVGAWHTEFGRAEGSLHPDFFSAKWLSEYFVVLICILIS